MKDYSTIRSGMLGGILFVILGNISSTDVIKTVVIAAVGAATSLLVTITLKWLMDRLRKKS